jgi:hypothetical protein
MVHHRVGAHLRVADSLPAFIFPLPAPAACTRRTTHTSTARCPRRQDRLRHRRRGCPLATGPRPLPPLTHQQLGSPTTAPPLLLPAAGSSSAAAPLSSDLSLCLPRHTTELRRRVPASGEWLTLVLGLTATQTGVAPSLSPSVWTAALVVVQVRGTVLWCSTRRLCPTSCL